MSLLSVEHQTCESKLLSNTTHLVPCYPAFLGARIPSFGTWLCENLIHIIPCLKNQARSIDLIVIQTCLNHGIVGVVWPHRSPTPPLLCLAFRISKGPSSLPSEAQAVDACQSGASPPTFWCGLLNAGSPLSPCALKRLL